MPINKIKVLRVIPDLQVGGVQRMMLQSIPRAREQGIETEVCCIKRKGELGGAFEAAGVPIHIIPFNSRLDPIALYKLRRLVIRQGYSLIHSHMYAANIAANLASIGLNRIRVVNSYHSNIPTSGLSQDRMIRMTRRIPRAWIAVSNAVRASLLDRGVPADRISVIYNGVEVPPEPCPLPERTQDGPLELLWVGRFVKQKRLSLIVAVMARCKELGLPVHCTLVGDGPLYQPISELVQAKGLTAWIDLPGYSNDVNAWLRRSDLFISASEREGFPNAMLEAGAIGRGIVASDIPPHRELLGGASAGFLAGDAVDEWLGALTPLIHDRSRVIRAGVAAHQRAGNYSIEKSFMDLYSLYDLLFKQPGKTFMAELNF